jgi:coupling of ubiquitin conjugation to ER degradation protein 1
LASKLNSADETNTNSSTTTSSEAIKDATPGRSRPKQAWSNDKAERSALLQKRREDMILAARRKMEEKEKAKGSS